MTSSRGCTAIGFEGLLRRRATGEPIQHITGETEFYGLPFRVTPDVLIPRPETEHLVEHVIALAAQFHSPRIVDVGTGSGAIAIALAHALNEAQLTAIDISDSALAIARENAERNGVASRIRFHEGNLLEPVAGERFDVVVSNPPYVPTSDRDTLSVEVRSFEPALALFAGEDGLDLYRQLIPAALYASCSRRIRRARDRLWTVRSNTRAAFGRGLCADRVHARPAGNFARRRGTAASPILTGHSRHHYGYATGPAMKSIATTRKILTDAHFLVPLVVFCIGVALLITLR